MPMHKPVKPILEVVKNAKTMEIRDLNRYLTLSKLDDGTYFLNMRSVYSGPTIARTKRRVSEESMIGIVQMFMEINGFSALKIEDGRLMYAKKSDEG